MTNLSYFKINYANFTSHQAKIKILSIFNKYFFKLVFIIQPLEKLQILYKIQKFTANHLIILIQSISKLKIVINMLNMHQ